MTASWARRAAAATAALFLFTCAPALAAEVSARAEYVVSLAGVNVASVAIDFSDDGRNFAIDVSARVSGVGTLVSSGTASAAAHGATRSNSLSPQDFELRTRTGDDNFNVSVEYASGNATAFKIEPPLETHAGRVAIERKHLRGVGDPLASFILKGDALGPELCNRRLPVFTGVERYDIAMRFGEAQTATSNRTAYQGPVILCTVDYIPISGHFKSSQITRHLAESDRILVWYAPLRDTGYFIPYRVLLGTNAGDLSMVLVGLD